MTRWLVLVVVVVVVLAIVIGMSLGGTTTVQAGRAKQGVMRAFVEERGKTRLPQTYRITMPADGRLAAITLKEGDRDVPRARILPRRGRRHLPARESYREHGWCHARPAGRVLDVGELRRHVRL